MALLSLLALSFTSIVNTQQALAGFADSAVIMVASLCVVAEALSRTGVTAWLGWLLLSRGGNREIRLTLC